ncbi:hypothetical protein [Rothia sp. HMSC065G12]|uniref:hypothetical protein n=1 Tax=Rothia sp. HMSC065G12 TaxID=1739308 RepID=UPI000ABACEC6|nr:hypothetical protein [Rothia sp. HMSC065G12]
MPKEREDVEATLEQVTTPDASQQKKKWRAIDCIAGSTLVIEVLLSIIWVIAWVCGYRFEHQLQVYLALVLIILTGGYLALIFCPIFKKDDDPRWFHARILSSGIVGGSYAFLLPVVMSLPEGNVNSGGAAALRQAILLATGGLIALIALGETRRKNDNDREAAENLRAHQENMLIQQKEQFEANSFKERKAERRERYTKAVEQLGDEKAPVRMGGVYTFVGLVDEWLEEESIEKYEDRLKEGQVIINNLCAYIRSPFTLASRYDELSKDNPISEGIYKDNQQKFYSDKAELKAEADVRLGIIQEIHDRIQVPDKNTPGAWSDFEYDFSGSTFFYPIDLTNSYYAKPINFSGSTYEGGANFSDSTYQGWADFSDSSYKGGAYFSASSYKGWADFTRSTYQGWADFSDSTYQGEANFNDSSYKGGAYFSDSTYQDEAYFSDSTYQGWANFSDSTYQDWANFSDSTYQDEVYFHSSTYKALAYFRRSTYQALADFRRSTYQDVADFSGSIFYQKVYFGVDGDNSSFSRFTDCAPQFYDETNHKNTLFGSPNNDFTVENGRGYPIYRNLEGLPLGCKFLTSEQKEYLEYKFQEIDETKNKLREIKDPKEKAELLKKLQALNEKLHEWREEATTVNVEGTAPEEKNN